VEQLDQLQTYEGECGKLGEGDEAINASGQTDLSLFQTVLSDNNTSLGLKLIVSHKLLNCPITITAILSHICFLEMPIDMNVLSLVNF